MTLLLPDRTTPSEPVADRDPLRAQRRSRLVRHALLIAAAVVMLYPLLWMFSASFKTEDQIFATGGLLPDPFDAANYAEGWNGVGTSFGRFLLNSAVVCLGAVIGNVIACSLAAYAFARLDFPFKRTLFAVMLVTIMLPHQVTLIPQYSVFLNLGWVNTYLPLIVPKFLAVDAFFIFLMVQFIRGIPRELDQSAEIDGCGPFSVYWRIVMPLARPAVVTTAIFTFIWTYDDFLSQLIYLSDQGKLTVPLGLRLFLDSTGESSWGPMLAMSVVSLLPVFGFFLAFQRLIVEGISTSGLKG